MRLLNILYRPHGTIKSFDTHLEENQSRSLTFLFVARQLIQVHN
jgi:hypothetical protein